MAERRALLESHYGFRCACARCVKEGREDLRRRARARGKQHVQNTSVLARNAYVHDLGGGGSTSSGVSKGANSRA